MSDHSPVGLIGIGLLGQALAHRLLGAGFEVAGFDVDPAKTAKLLDLGGRPPPPSPTSRSAVPFPPSSSPSSAPTRSSRYRARIASPRSAKAPADRALRQHPATPRPHVSARRARRRARPAPARNPDLRRQRASEPRRGRRPDRRRSRDHLRDRPAAARDLPDLFPHRPHRRRRARQA